jgi:hypothetical protein
MVSTNSTAGHSRASEPSFPAAPPASCSPSPAGNLLFLTANGSRDSHAVTLADGRKNRSPRAGRQYQGISWDGIRRLIDAPAARLKNDAPFVILSTYRECDGRTHAIQRENGWFGGLAVDIDHGNPTLPEVVEAVAAATGGSQAWVYSSASSAPDRRKWRVLIPLTRPISGSDYADTQAALFGLLRDRGLTCDFTLTRAAQPVYLPNVPPDRRDETGRPNFYQAHYADGPVLDLAPGAAIVEERDALRRLRAARAAEAAARRAEHLARRLARAEATGDDFDPIEDFNRTHAIASLLALYGFKQKPGTDHYRSPLSKSGSFSTQDRGDHWITVSAWAHDHNIGRISQSGNRYGDAFSLFVAFEHGGDARAAVVAYLAEIGRLGGDLDEPEPVVVETLPDRGEPRSLDDWRLEMQVERSLAVRMPGLHLDRSPTGSGKTHATTTAIVDAIETTKREAKYDDTVRPLTRTLTILPDHANIRERVREYRAAGLQAVAYPARDETTCGNLEAVKRAEGLGLVAGAAVCSAPCPLRDSCAYLKQVAEAEAADHAIGTHERFRLSPGPTARERDLIVIDETPEAVLAPAINLRVDDLSPVAALASTVREGLLLFRNNRVVEAGGEERAFADRIIGAYDLIVEAARRATEPGVVEIPLPSAAEVPKGWQKTVLRWAVETGFNPGHDRHKRERFQKSLRLLTMIVKGDLERLHLLVDQTSRHKRLDDGTVEETEHLHHFVVGSWKTRLPNVPILCLDATADADGIRAATGREVRDCTPEGHLPNVAPVVQVPWDVTADQEPSTAAGFVEAFLTSHPEVERLGLIGHQDHIRAMMDDDDVLPPRLRARVAKACWFGAGPDRASNGWHEACDAMLVVGTMRPGGGPVKERLVLHGKVEAARRDGDWGVRHWEATTTDGRRIVVEGKGYRDAEWHTAHAAISRAAVHQAAGRGRAITEKGIPVWIVSDEPMGCPVDDSLEPVSPVVRATVEAVRAVRDGTAGTSLFPIEGRYRKKSGSQTAVRVSAVVTYLLAEAARAGRRLGASGAEKRLRLARRHGRLDASEKGWLVVVGDEPAETPLPSPAPSQAVVLSSTPRPAAVGLPVHAAIITNHGPDEPAHAVEVAAQVTPETTTAVCTSTAPADLPPVVDGLLEAVEERAAILEFEGGYARDAAERFAREMVEGRGTMPPATVENVGVDHGVLAARMHPLVDHSARAFGGTVRMIRPEEGPFPASPGIRTATAKPRPNGCRCGGEGWKDVPIHGGRSARRECARCGGFLRWAVWYGRPCDDKGNPISETVRFSDGPPITPVVPIPPTGEHCLTVPSSPLVVPGAA